MICLYFREMPYMAIYLVWPASKLVAFCFEDSCCKVDRHQYYRRRGYNLRFNYEIGAFGSAYLALIGQSFVSLQKLSFLNCSNFALFDLCRELLIASNGLFAHLIECHEFP